MSGFEASLTKARRRQFVGLFLGGVVFLCLAAAVASVILTSGGTRILVQPEEASSSYRMEISSGLAVAIDNVVYSLSPTSSVIVSAPGYHKVDRKIETHEKGKNLSITLVELPAKLSFSTQPSVDKTKWFIRDNLVGVGETLSYEIPPGEYDLTVNNPYFEIANLSFSARRGEEVVREIPIKPVSGEINIVTQPNIADVTIDGKIISPDSFPLLLKGGVYVVSVAADNYQTIEEKIEITNSSLSVSRDYRLRPLSAQLTIETKPSGGQLMLNGRRVKQGEAYSVAVNKQHRVTFFKEGYVSAAKAISVKSGQSRSLSIELQAEIGDVEFRSNPAARIYVNGELRGEAPQTLSLRALPTEIEFRKEGYRSFKKTIKPTNKRTTLVSTSLQTEQSARLAESPLTYTNSIGTELKRFSPGTFIMGAPRHERRQRANEFLREIKLEREFYAAVHEVTNAEFKEYKQEHTGDDALPVVQVSWLEAALFCNWLSEKEGRKPFYRLGNSGLEGVNPSSGGYRLLTEAEWAWLSRKAGRRNQTVFPWGDESVVPANAGNIADESANGIADFYVPNYTDRFSRLSPVGSFPPEKSGLHDLTGNVSEWVHDFYSLQPPKAGVVETDPLGPTVGSIHVVRGSSWRSGTRSSLRAAFRRGATGPADDIGFRIGRYL